MKNIFLLSVLMAAIFASQLQSQTCLTINAPTPSGCDISENDPQLWNAQPWWSATSESTDLPENAMSLRIELTENCGGVPPTVSYVLLLDLDNDGTRETEIDSENPPAAGEIIFNGNPATFDARPVQANQKWRFALEQTLVGNVRTALVGLETAAQPGLYVLPQIPEGNHLIRWKSGGNVISETAFEVEDCKKPTVFCNNGLTVNLMPTGNIMMWASDFLTYGHDNATPANLLQYSIRKAGTGTGFPLDGSGQPVSGVNFECPEIGKQDIELWARDRNGLSGFCQTSLEIADIFNICTSSGSANDLTVCAKRCINNTPIEDVTISAAGTAGTGTGLTDATGCTTFISPNFGTPIVLSASKNGPIMSGVTTFDLVLLSRHILGVEPLDSYCKMIAADVNGSGSITSFDLVETRKAILGIYQNFPNAPNWRFWDANWTPPNPANPFATTIPSTIVIGSLTGNTTANFHGVKTGDVNGTAILANIENRSQSFLFLENQRLVAGETATLPVFAGGFSNPLGLQFSLNFDFGKMEIEEILPGSLKEISPENYFSPAPGTLNFSWLSTDGNAARNPNAEPLFYLKIKALREAEISEVLNFSTQNLAPEIYFEGENANDLSLLFREKTASPDEPTFSKISPNPASETAFFTVNLPNAETLRLEIFDVSGKQIFAQLSDFEAGTQRVELPLANLPPGNFVLRASAAGKTAVEKFVKN